MGKFTSSAAQTSVQPEFVLEGSVFVAGADVQALAETVPDSGGVIVVPAFTGLGAPYWKPDARGAILGLSRGSTLAHIARAALESIALQSAALLEAMQKDAAQAGTPRCDRAACGRWRLRK